MEERAERSRKRPRRVRGGKTCCAQVHLKRKMKGGRVKKGGPLSSKKMAHQGRPDVGESEEMNTSSEMISSTSDFSKVPLPVLQVGCWCATKF